MHNPEKPREETADARPKPRMMAASLGDCVHVAGVLRFLELAAEEGYETRFLGAAQPIASIVKATTKWKPDILAVSYRLSPEALINLLEQLVHELSVSDCPMPRMVFGGTDGNCRAVEDKGIFEALFGSSATPEVVGRYLRGEPTDRKAHRLPDTLIARIQARAPFPLIRHHFGLPTVDDTVKGARLIAESEALDVLSIGPDQNAQASFFRSKDMDPSQDGAGGVPLRTEDDLSRIYAASRAGNSPLVRCYSGTRDLVQMADVLNRTINNAWGAIPLYWYSDLDRRSDRPLRSSIPEAQRAMAWHAERGIPVEVNESHQWSLRSAPDTVAVVAFFLAAYNAKRAGVKDYIAQFMFNTPHGTTPAMDLAKMLAKAELVQQIESKDFRVWRQTRTGLASMPADKEAAIGHLSASITMQMAMKPNIVHVVAFSEADHAALAQDVIDSARIGRGAVSAALYGNTDPTHDPRVISRRDELIRDAKLLLDAIKHVAPEGTQEPWCDAETLARAVEKGLMDAPDLMGIPAAKGTVRISLDDGACRAVGSDGVALKEAERIEACLA